MGVGDADIEEQQHEADHSAGGERTARHRVEETAAEIQGGERSAQSQGMFTAAGAKAQQQVGSHRMNGPENH